MIAAQNTRQPLSFVTECASIADFILHGDFEEQRFWRSKLQKSISKRQASPTLKQTSSNQRHKNLRMHSASFSSRSLHFMKNRYGRAINRQTLPVYHFTCLLCYGLVGQERTRPNYLSRHSKAFPSMVWIWPLRGSVHRGWKVTCVPDIAILNAEKMQNLSSWRRLWIAFMGKGMEWKSPLVPPAVFIVGQP